jgi:tRNA-specific 2-thiouridylase
MSKREVRRAALEAGFANHAKKDSTGICFIGERRFKEFLSRYLPAQPGEIRTLDGRGIGRHDGLMFHTLGQRKGLGLGGRRDGTGEAWYVVAKDLEQNVLYVAQGHDHPLLFSRELTVDQVHWIAGDRPRLPLHCQAKTRYRQPDQVCTVFPAGPDRYLVRFEQPQRAATPGQSIVLYLGEHCLGGGVIDRVVSAEKSSAAVHRQYG